MANSNPVRGMFIQVCLCLPVLKSPVSCERGASGQQWPDVLGVSTVKKQRVTNQTRKLV
jgi:hypothetical protein